MNLVRQCLKATLKTCLPPSLLLTEGRQARSEAEPIRISLTFDDGPHPEHTPKLLDNLASFGLKGTFFVVGERAAQYPELVRRIQAEGHELANHTWTHSEPAQTSTRQFLDEVQKTRQWLQDLIGQDCQLVRPPKGRLSLGKLWGLLRSRQTIVLWNRDPRDYRMESWCDMEDWCQSYQPHHGDLVLLHDNHPHAATAAVLFGSLPQLNSVESVPVSRWLRA